MSAETLSVAGVAKIYGGDGLAVPGIVDVAGHVPANKNITISDPIVQGFSDAVATGYARPQIAAMDNYWGNFGDALNQVLDKGADPVAAVKTACTAMNKANNIP